MLCERPEVRAIGVHIEGLSDVPAFERAALKALTAGTPLVALKTGSSAIGGALTLSHTGSLAGANELYEALFARTGVICVTNPSQFLETLKFLCVAGVPTGHEVLGFTCSGGGATMLADHGESIGLIYPAPDKAAKKRLTEVLPPIATVSNPLDYTTPIWGQPDVTTRVFTTALETVAAQATLLVQDYPAAGLDETKQLYLNDGLAFASAATKAGLPAAICASLPENIDAATRDLFISHGIAPMQGIHETLNAIRDAAQWGAARRRILAHPPMPLLQVKTAVNPGFETEDIGKKRLGVAGISVPDGRVVKAADIGLAAQALDFPVVLKMMSPELPHKTEAGAVALGLQTPADVIAAATTMRSTVANRAPLAVTDMFLLESMAPPPLAELVVGIRRDPQFGLAMTLGSGGILVELVGDAKTLLLPTGIQDIKSALLDLRVSALLHGFRGRPPVDIDLLASAISGLADYVTAHKDEIVELEINPLFVI